MLNGRLRLTGSLVALFTFILLSTQTISAAQQRPKPAVAPSLLFATSVGGRAAEEGRTIATDSSGFIYVAGSTRSLSFADLSSAKSLSGKTDIFLSKMRHDGTVVYTAYLNGSDADLVNAITVDTSGNVYLAGETNSANFPVYRPLQAACTRDISNSCSGDAFVAKIDANGKLIYSTVIGGTGKDVATAVAADADGNAFIAGSTSSTDFPVINHFQSAAAGKGDAFVAKISADGSHVIYATYLGGSGADEARSIAVDRSGSVYVAGQTTSINFPTHAPLQPNCAMGAAATCVDAFVSKFSLDGSELVYSTYIGGSGHDSTAALALDETGNAYVTGSTDSSDFPVAHALQGVNGGEMDAFVAKLDATGAALIYSTYLGGSAEDAGTAIAVDPDGGVHVTGRSTSLDLLQKNAIQERSIGADAFVAGLDSIGSTLLYSTYLGGQGNDTGNGIALDASGNVFVTGGTDSRNGEAFVAALSDAFTARDDTRKAKAADSVQAVGACTNTYIGASGGSWGTAGNWSGGIPVSTDVACIPAGVTVLLDSPLAVANQTISALNNLGTLTITNGPLTLTNESAAATLSIDGPTLTVNGLFNVTTLILSSGGLTGVGDINVSGVFTWSGGTLSGASTLTANGEIQFPTQTVGWLRYLINRTLVNNGTASFTGSTGTLQTLGSAIINNLAGATWDFENDSGITGGIFNNAGTVKKSGGGSAGSTIAAIFNNTGSVEVTGNGTGLTLSGGGSCGSACNGSFSVASTDTLTFAGYNIGFVLNGSISGAGSVVFTGSSTTTTFSGTYNVTGATSVSGIGGSATANFVSPATMTNVGALTVSSGLLNFSSGGTISTSTVTLLYSGVLTGTDTINASGMFTWSGGTLSGSSTFNANGGISFPNGTGRGLSGRTLVNNGTATFKDSSYSSLNMDSGAVINNPAGSTWDFQDNSYISRGGFPPTGTFNNAGTLKKTAGTGTSSISAVFNNTGSVQVAGTGNSLTLSGGGTCGGACNGSFSVGAGGTLSFGGTYALNGSITGAGAVVFVSASSETTTFSGTYNITGGTSVQGNARANFVPPATVTNVGALSVNCFCILNFSSGGTISASTVGLSQGFLTGTDTINASGMFTWYGGTLSGDSTFNANGGISFLGTPFASKTLTRTLVNNGTATFSDLFGALSISPGSALNNPAGSALDFQNDSWISGGAINNAGTFMKTGGVDPRTFSNVAFSNSGTVLVSIGALVFGGGSYTQTAGTTMLNGGKITFPSNMSLQGGVLLGVDPAAPPAITGNVSNTGGTVHPGLSPGIINETGNYTQDAGGSLNIDIGGTTAGTFSQYILSGTATLNGTLNVTLVNGFVPVDGNSFTILTSSARTGTFSAVNLPSATGISFSVSYNATSVIVNVGPGVGPVPLKFIPVTPCRILDTRVGSGFTGAFGPPFISGNTTRTIPVASSGCAIPPTAQAYSVNATVVPHGFLDYLTLWPTGITKPFVSTLNAYDGQVTANAAVVPAGSSGSINAYASQDTDLILDINGYFLNTSINTALVFYPVTPCRVLDTRNPNGTFGGPLLIGGTSRSFPIPSSSCGIPITAQAFAFNATAVPTDGFLDYMTLWPTGADQPNASTLNSYDGQVTANMAIVPAGTNGSIDAFVTNDTHLILDITGYFAPPGQPGGLHFFTLAPCRVVDTRNPDGPFGGPVLSGGTNRSFPVQSSSCGVPATSQAYSMNATVVPSGFLDYLTMWPTGVTQPFVSTLNAYDGQVTANALMVPAGTGGAVSAFATQTTHLIVDISGYFAP
jgi:beta-propeller repeat-containing protein